RIWKPRLETDRSGFASNESSSNHSFPFLAYFVRPNVMALTYGPRKRPVRFNARLSGRSEVGAKPSCLMMVQSATIRNEGWIQKGSKAAEGSMVPLTHDREAVSDQERCSHSHSGLISTLRHKAAAIRNDLTAAGGAHVGQDSEFNVALSGE